MQSQSKPYNGSMSSSGSALGNFKHPLCTHGLPMKEYTSNKEPNVGRPFLTCPHWRNEARTCRLFWWIDEYIDMMNSGYGYGPDEAKTEEVAVEVSSQKKDKGKGKEKEKEKETENEMWKGKFETLQRKMMKKKQQKAVLEEQCLKLKIEAASSAQGLKIAMMCLVVSWVMLAIVWMY